MPDSERKLVNSLHAFSFAIETKPLKALESLFENLTPHGIPFTLEEKNKMVLHQSEETAFVLLINEGCCSIHHSLNEQHITTLFAPSITGLLDSYGLYYDVKDRPQHYIRAISTCSGWKIPLAAFVETCDSKSLWHDIARVLAHRLMVMSAREEELVGGDAYSKIRALLIELWFYPEHVRLKTNVATFLQNRTMISRSRIMGILFQLRKGGYIDMVSGKLTNISLLPRSF